MLAPLLQSELDAIHMKETDDSQSIDEKIN
jgi:hypothetical protein